MFNTEDDTQESKQEDLELDRAREAHVSQIRKSNRDDIINKRRNLNRDIDQLAQESARQQRLVIGDAELSDRIEMYLAG